MTNTPIQFCEDPDKIDIAALQNLLNLCAFWAEGRTKEGLEVAIANSNPVITVWEGERLIGFSRATTDCVYRATIWDVVIHPEYRGIGLGSKLVETMLAHPRINGVERVYLMTTYQQDFYKQIGFQENHTTTMVIYNNDFPQHQISSEQSEQLTNEIMQQY
ncbi:MAG: GNAT family N-acetyltransferase [Cyanobacteria bacterium SW_9_44_58]|nr:MAG: GNAT family N-acetyltransferase [Cyanobacteria bacterium SW_9_44_58]